MKFQIRVNVKIKICISCHIYFLENNTGYKTILSTKEEPENAQMQHNVAPDINSGCWVIQAKIHTAVFYWLLYFYT